jgi:hypothetical protein
VRLLRWRRLRATKVVGVPAVRPMVSFSATSSAASKPMASSPSPVGVHGFVTRYRSETARRAVPAPGQRRHGSASISPPGLQPRQVTRYWEPRSFKFSTSFSRRDRALVKQQFQNPFLCDVPGVRTSLSVCPPGGYTKTGLRDSETADYCPLASYMATKCDRNTYKRSSFG